MSDPRLDALADTARNRGLKLIRSRVRSPQKRRFGKVGLTDKTGKAVFGMDDKGPAAKPEEVEDYLRGLGASDWGASLDVAVLPRKRKPSKVAPAAANDCEPVAKAPASRPTPPPKPTPPEVRQAKPSDAPELLELMALLEHDLDEQAVRKNIGKLQKARELPLVATLDEHVIGFCGVHRMTAIHRPVPVGRITILVVAESGRKRGIGRLLVDAAEQWCRKQGCALLEITSNDRLGPAHAFYRHLGYERTSIRFVKKL